MKPGHTAFTVTPRAENSCVEEEEGGEWGIERRGGC